jgi:branched-chain amino acid transport system substrate-binding protein
LIRDYTAAGLRKTIPLFGSGFLTDGVLEATEEPAQGLETTLHYADGLNTKRDREFRSAYTKAYTFTPDVYAVQGYDAALLLASGLEAVKGDITKRKEVVVAMENTKIDSPRGAWTMSKAHNPVQDIYLRKVVGRENKFVSVAHKALADPARGCKM